MKLDPITLVDHISPTSLSTFSDCRLQWYWYGPLGYQAISRAVAFDIGEGVHLALAKFYKGKQKGKEVDLVAVFTKWADKRLDELELDDADEIQKAAHVRTMGITMLEGYASRYRHEQLEVLAVEKEVSRPLPGTGWSIDCRIVAIVKDHGYREKVFVLEHKTFTRFLPGYLIKDHQFVAEVWAAEMLMTPIHGLIYNGLRKQIPSPRVRVPLFERHTVEVNEFQVKGFLRRARGMWNQLSAPTLSVYPEPNPVRCSMCQFSEPCTAYMRGEDYQFILDSEYVKRDRSTEAEGEDA